MRFLHMLYAKLLGYFWMPCPACFEDFGGHEIAHGWPHVNVTYENRAYCVCPRCSARAKAEGITANQWGVIELHPQEFVERA